MHDIFCTFSHVFVSFCRVSSPGMGTAVKKIKGPAAYLRTTFPRSGEPKAPQPLPLRGSRGEGGGWGLLTKQPPVHGVRNVFDFGEVDVEWLSSIIAFAFLLPSQVTDLLVCPVGQMIDSKSVAEVLPVLGIDEPRIKPTANISSLQYDRDILWPLTTQANRASKTRAQNLDRKLERHRRYAFNRSV